MNKVLFVLFATIFSLYSTAQTPKSYTSSEILLKLKKLNVLGSVLYIAAHPDDENTRLLAYLANEKLFRTGYLSLTRGDGGQNLIGDEQGIDLGLIRTQELLAARRIDGAEQFFSRAYDFGFCKTSEEALETWGHDKILSDIVWVIRKFRPDVIITRFPEDSRAGHGHHSASAILAREAYGAAADATKFPEQLQNGITVWQAKRLLWNTFNFGSTNTQSEDQFKQDVGMYNPLLGKSYGEIAALSRSQHKSQGFGVPAQRGAAIEYFATVKGDKPLNSLEDGVNTSWERVLSGAELISRPAREDNVQGLADSIIKNFSPEHPEKSVGALVRLYKKVETVNTIYWKEQKLKEIKDLLEACSGIFLDATTSVPYAVQGDSLKVTAVLNNRLGIDINNASVTISGTDYVFGKTKRNDNLSYSHTFYVDPASRLTQPYWLENRMEKGSFNVTDQQLIGKAENDPSYARFNINIEGVNFIFEKPVRYKYTDPVKGEIYQPLPVMPAIDFYMSPKLLVNSSGKITSYKIILTAHREMDDYQGSIVCSTSCDTPFPAIARLKKTLKKDQKNEISVSNYSYKTDSCFTGRYRIIDKGGYSSSAVNKIAYDHIPSIVYFSEPQVKIIRLDINTNGHLLGYIPGAGDKVPQALEQMGYKVTLLKETDITIANLRQFDAVVTGIRAYNVNEWLSNSYDPLMQYVKEGGVLLVQYNTNNSIGPVKAKISPYPFTISRNRITDEEAKVNFLLPAHPALNYPNKITQKDFEGWVQERSVYNAESIDSNFKRILSMQDAKETAQDGSLIISNYGKGRFVYTGLSFFRQLPAGVPGAYRLFANLIANKRRAVSQ